MPSNKPTEHSLPQLSPMPALQDLEAAEQRAEEIARQREAKIAAEVAEAARIAEQQHRELEKRGYGLKQDISAKFPSL